jgi:hypothetical protein
MASKRKAAEGFNARDWIALNEVLERARDSIGSLDLALGQVYRDFCDDDRLRSGAQRKPPGKAYSTEPPEWRTFDATFWRERVERLVRDDRGVVRLILRLGQEPLTGSWYFFGHRADVEKLYPVSGGPAREAAAAGDPMKPPPSPRGPKAIKDWPTCVAREVIRILRAGEPLPKADHFRSHCEKTLGHTPHLRDVQTLLAKLLK